MYRIARDLEQLFPIIFFLFFFIIVTVSTKKKRSQRSRTGASSARHAPLRTNVPKANASRDDEYEYVGVTRVDSKRAGSVSTAKDSASSIPKPAVKIKTPSRTVSMDSFTMEDRQNDWLAKQLREERRALRTTSAMFDLKMEHTDSCEADELKQSHARAHRAGKLY